MKYSSLIIGSTFNTLFVGSGIVAYGNDIYVIYIEGGGFKLKYTSDLVNFYETSVFTESVDNTNSLTDITFRKGKFIAVGNIILSSVDGINWNTHTSPVSGEIRTVY